ncbi:MAG: aminotransferase class I/II-fold pyridoxal phosphate-dependent enzyme [Kiritimatiellae bacterium]|nr:aminotransferase class I/II-fold pyridoxal phosphate-dependent enzyme [Kiritimatiellia bacterium]
MNLVPFALERYFARYEFVVSHLLCTSDCESVSLGELLDLEPEARPRLEKMRLGYTETKGAPTLRKVIAGMYDNLTPEDVLVLNGGEEAIFVFMHAILRPGDHVVVHWPCYQSLHELPRSIGCEVTLWRAAEDRAWLLDIDELKCLLRPDTRAIVLNMPHNPSGSLMSRRDFSALINLAEERNVLVFSDEVYRFSEYDPARRLPAACEASSKGVSLGALSKIYGLPGVRIAWVATRNPVVLEKMTILRDYTTICNCGPAEFLAELALRHREKLLSRNLEIIRRNLELLDTFFARHGDRFEWRRPVAGPVGFPKLLCGQADEFCERLVNRVGVLLLPGSVFGDTGNHVRFGFGRMNMPEALTRLEEFLADDKNCTRLPLRRRKPG